MAEKIERDDVDNPQIDLWEEVLDNYSQENDVEFETEVFYWADSREDPTLWSQNRIALADKEGEETKDTNKYVLLHRYDNPNLMTLDLVRIPLPDYKGEEHHVDIADEYVGEILSEIGEQALPVDDGRSEFLTAGGHILNDDEEGIGFYNGSGRFGNELGAYSSNDVAQYLIEESNNFEAREGSAKPKEGERYVQECLDMLQESDSIDELRSNLIDLYVGQPEDPATKSQQMAMLTSLANMRAREEDMDYMLAFQQEYVKFDREMMGKAVEMNLEREEEEERY